MFDVDLRADGAEPRPIAADGYVELCGLLREAGGWLVSGWTRRAWAQQTSTAARLHFPLASLTACATTRYFERDDLRDGALGFVLLLRCPAATEGWLLDMTVDLAEGVLRLLPAVGGLPMPESKLRAAAGRLLQGIGDPEIHALVRAWLARRAFAGVDTLAEAAGAIRLELEWVMPCLAAGLIMIGWLDDPAECIAALHIRSGDRLRMFDTATWVRLPRQDVQAALAAGAEDYALDRGFLAYFPDIRAPGEALYVEIECTDGSVAYRPVERITCTGIAAMQRVLGACHLDRAALSRAMDRVIGPAVAALNADRLRVLPATRELRFGASPAPAQCSVIMHLACSADALEWQLALQSEAARPDVEFIFVLDDPNLRDAVLQRADTCLARFGLPFRLLLLDRFVGQAPSLNLAARIASADVLCFLNPEGLPDRSDWLESLLTRLTPAAGIGATGALVDGACEQPDADVTELSADCLAIQRGAFDDVGGFSEDYAIDGDIGEDLCRKLREAGLRCVQCQDVTLAVPAASGEARSLWRSNLAQYNAWQRHRRWPPSRPAAF